MFRMPQAVEIFRKVEVGHKEVSSFRRNKATLEVVRRIQGRIYELGQRFGKEANDYERLKGEAAGLQWVLAEMDTLGDDPEEQEESEDILV